MDRRTLIGGAALLALGLGAGMAQAQEARTFYWISHGAPADPVWTYFLQGAEQWAADTGHTVNTSFHSGDVPSHQEAVRAAIAAGAQGICSTSPDPGSMVDVVAEAREVLAPDGLDSLLDAVEERLNESEPERQHRLVATEGTPALLADLVARTLAAPLP